MTYFPLSKEQQDLKEMAAKLATSELAPRAAEIDKAGTFPRASLDGLKASGLWGLRVSKEHGGLDADLLSTCLVVEELAKKCASTAMCYKMHVEAAELISKMPSDYQVEHFVKKIAAGEILCTVAGGETSGGAGGDWVPGMVLSSVEKGGDGYIVDNVRKSYVTSAGQATHYFMMCRVGSEAKGHEVTALFIEANKINLETLEDWNGLGMRGNNSMPILFNGVVPEENRLGDEGKALKYLGALMMPVVALTYGAAYLGVASGAYELAMEEASKVHPSGAKRLDSPINQRRMAELSAKIEAARALLHVAAAAGDAGQVAAPLPYLQAKVACSEVAVLVTQELMTMFGGTAFAARLPFERYFRDARAGMIMGLANDDAYQTIYSMLFPEKRG